LQSNLTQTLIRLSGTGRRASNWRLAICSELEAYSGMRHGLGHRENSLEVRVPGSGGPKILRAPFGRTVRTTLSTGLILRIPLDLDDDVLDCNKMERFS
jgi:hypothetical protein